MRNLANLLAIVSLGCGFHELYTGMYFNPANMFFTLSCFLVIAGQSFRRRSKNTVIYYRNRKKQK